MRLRSCGAIGSRWRPKCGTWRDCGTDRTNAPLCKSVIDLAHNFGSAAVAVGIEKAADVLALTSMGCDLGQGYLLGQPMPEERLISLLRQRAAGQNRPMPTTARA